MFYFIKGWIEGKIIMILFADKKTIYPASTPAHVPVINKLIGLGCNTLTRKAWLDRELGIRVAQHGRAFYKSDRAKNHNQIVKDSKLKGEASERLIHGNWPRASG